MSMHMRTREHRSLTHIPGRRQMRGEGAAKYSCREQLQVLITFSTQLCGGFDDTNITWLNWRT
jgi:hypothetical protein